MLPSARLHTVESVSGTAGWELLGPLGEERHAPVAFWDPKAKTVATWDGKNFNDKWPGLAMHNRKVHFAAVVTSPSGQRHVAVCTLRNRNFWTFAVATPGTGTNAAAVSDLTAGFDNTLAVACGESAAVTKDAKRDFFAVDDCACTAGSVVLVVSPRKIRPRVVLVSSRASASWQSLNFSMAIPRDGLCVCTPSSNESVKLSVVFSGGTPAGSGATTAVASLTFWQPATTVAPSTGTGSGSCVVLYERSIVFDGRTASTRPARTLQSGSCDAAMVVDAACHLPGAQSIAFSVGLTHLAIVNTSEASAVVHRLPFAGGRPSLGCVPTVHGAVVAAMDQRTGQLFLASSWEVASSTIDAGKALCGDGPRTGQCFRVSHSGEGVMCSSGTKLVALSVEGALANSMREGLLGLPHPPAAAPLVTSLATDTVDLAPWLRQWTEASSYRRVADDSGRTALLAARVAARPTDCGNQWVASSGLDIISSEARSVASASVHADSPAHAVLLQSFCRGGLLARDLLIKASTAAFRIELRKNDAVDVVAVSDDSLITPAAAARVLFAQVTGMQCSLVAESVALDGGVGDVPLLPQALASSDVDAIAPALVDLLVASGDVALGVIVALGTGHMMLVDEIIASPRCDDLVEASDSVGAWFISIAEATVGSFGDVWPMGWIDAGHSTRTVIPMLDSLCNRVAASSRRHAIFSLCLLAWATLRDPRLLRRMENSPFKHGVFLVAAWVVSVRAQKADGDAQTLAQCRRWWRAATPLVAMGDLLSTYRSVSSSALTEGGAKDVTPDQVMGALCLRHIALASYVEMLQGSVAEALRSEITEHAFANVHTLAEGAGGLIVPSSTIRNMALSLAEGLRTSSSLVVHAKALLNATVGSDAEAHEKIRFSKLPAALASSGTERTINPADVMPWAQPEVKQVCQAAWPRSPCVEAMGSWSTAVLPLERSAAFWQWLAQVDWANPKMQDDDGTPSAGFLSVDVAESPSPSVHLFSGLATLLAPPHARSDAPAALVAKARSPSQPQPTLKAPEQHADPTVSFTDPDVVESEFFREGDVAWWEELSGVAVPDVGAQVEVGSSTTMTTLTSEPPLAQYRPPAELPSLQRKSRHGHANESSSESSSGVSYLREPVTKLTRRTLRQERKTTVEVAAPALLSLPTAATRLRSTAEAPLRGVGYLGASAPAPTPLTLLELPVAPSNLSAVAEVAPLPVQSSLPTVPGPKSDTALVATSPKVPAPAAAAPVTRQEDRCRAADALSEEMPLPPTTVTLFGDDGHPKTVETRSGVTVNAVPILDAAQEAAFGRYVQHLLTSALLGKDGHGDALPRSGIQQQSTGSPAAERPSHSLDPRNETLVASAFAAAFDFVCKSHFEAAQALFEANRPISPRRGSDQKAGPQSIFLPSDALAIARLVDDSMQQRERVLMLMKQREALAESHTRLDASLRRAQADTIAAREAARAPTPVPTRVADVQTEPEQKAKASASVSAAPPVEAATTQTQSESVPATPAVVEVTTHPAPLRSEETAARLIADLNKANGQLAASLRVADDMDTALARSHRLLADLHAPVNDGRDENLALAVSHRARAEAARNYLTADLHHPWHGSSAPGIRPPPTEGPSKNDSRRRFDDTADFADEVALHSQRQDSAAPFVSQPVFSRVVEDPILSSTQTRAASLAPSRQPSPRRYQPASSFEGSVRSRPVTAGDAGACKSVRPSASVAVKPRARSSASPNLRMYETRGSREKPAAKPVPKQAPPKERTRSQPLADESKAKMDDFEAKLRKAAAARHAPLQSRSTNGAASRAAPTATVDRVAAFEAKLQKA